jgi:hypothetical protein
MKHFTPTLPPVETSENVRNFIKNNMDTFWTILKPLLPFIVGLELIDIFINHFFFANSDKELALGSLSASYFVGALMISWHRVVIHGADRYVPMNPFKPKKSELAFMFVPFGLAFIYGFGGVLLALASAKIGGQAIAAIVLVLLIAFGIVAAFKISFYLPAKAVDAGITFKQSWNMTTGYLWKIFTAGFLSGWRVVLVMMVYAVGAGAIGGIIGGTLFGVHTLGFNLLLFVVLLPVIVLAQPLLAVIGVTVLSNYYQWAINNPRTVP